MSQAELRFFPMAVLLALSASMPAWQDAEAADPWAPAGFLLGSWSTAGLNRPEEGIGAASFSLELDGNIVVRKNRVEFSPRIKGEKPVVHEDLMVICREAGKFRALYFDNEKHVIEYGVAFSQKEKTAVFETLNSDGPRFKLLYRLLPDGTLASEFYIAQPGKEFSLYLKGAARRVD